jgi:hypothetical protein
LRERRASFDKLRMRTFLHGIEKEPHAKLVEARTTLVPIATSVSKATALPPRSIDIIDA